MSDESTGHNISSDTLSTDEIYERVAIDGEEEISREFRELFFSAFAAGLAITITVLLYASMTHSTDGAAVLSAILYPLGFIYIIIGKYQLYTENTLPPVVLVIDRTASVPALLGMWMLVLIGNLAGGAVGAALLAYTDLIGSGVRETLAGIGTAGVETSFEGLFVKAAIAGLIVAGVVWMNYSVTEDIARIVLVYLAFLAIPLGGLYHVVVSSTEVFFLFFIGEIALLDGLINFALPVLLGNTAGGVLLVAIVNYYQTSAEIHQFSEELSIREWLLTYNRGMPPEQLEEEIEEHIKH